MEAEGIESSVGSVGTSEGAMELGHLAIVNSVTVAGSFVVVACSGLADLLAVVVTLCSFDVVGVVVGVVGGAVADFVVGAAVV